MRNWKRILKAQIMINDVIAQMSLREVNKILKTKQSKASNYTMGGT